MVPISVTGVHNCPPNCFITGQGGLEIRLRFSATSGRREALSRVSNMYLLAAVISQERVIYLYARDSDSNTFNGNSHGWLCSREGGKGWKRVRRSVDGRNWRVHDGARQEKEASMRLGPSQLYRVRFNSHS